MTETRLRLGQLLVDARMITPESLEEVLALQRADGRRLGTLLVERALINETQLTQILSHQLAVPWVSLLHIEFSRQLLNLVPREIAERYCLVPIYVRNVRGQGDTLYVAMDDPSNEEALAECAQFSGLPVRAMIAPPSDIENAIRVYYGGAPLRPARPEPPAPPRPVSEAPRARRSERPPRLGSRVPPPAPEPPESGEELPFDLTRPAALAPPPAPDAASLAAPPSGSGLARSPAEKVRGLLFGAGDAGDPPSPPSETDADVEVRTIPRPRGRAPKMVALTLLDGTTISLPARGKQEAPAEPAPDDGADAPGLTAGDLVAALRAVAHGADASEVLGDKPRWESLFAALLSLLLKKRLIADWEFVDELKKM